MSDRIGIMNQGKILQLGTPEEIYEHPKSRFAAQFIGQSNILKATVTGRDAAGNLTLSFGGGTILASGQGEPGEKVTLSLRTERGPLRKGAPARVHPLGPGEKQPLQRRHW